MDAPPPVKDPRRDSGTFWLTVAFLLPASILRVATVVGSLGCLGVGEVVFLCVPYATLFGLAWLVNHSKAAAAVVAICTVVTTAVPLLFFVLPIVALRWPHLRGFWCGLNSDLATGCFVGVQFFLTILTALISLFLWDSYRLRTGQTRGW
jgi:hypothetical protein